MGSLCVYLADERLCYMAYFILLVAWLKLIQPSVESAMANARFLADTFGLFSLCLAEYLIDYFFQVQKTSLMKARKDLIKYNHSVK